jgi:uncharacterized protein involved in exopolysaccharide biosynthesis/Mrp family chromosome partitioning ATPase
MIPKQASPPAPAAISVRDVYYILFRHKWMITILAALGLGAAAAVYTLWPFPYGSEAKLFIRYVQDTRSPSEIEAGSTKVMSPDGNGANIMNSELELLTSGDLALQVADRLAVQGLLTKTKRDTNRNVTAGFIAANLKADAIRGSDVIRLRFTAKEPELVQPVLTELIAAYKLKHAEIHLAPGVSEEFLQKQTDEAKARLDETSATLREEKNKAGITSADEDKTGGNGLATRIQEQLIQFQAELAESRATASDLQRRIALETPGQTSTNSATNASGAQPAPPSPDVVLKYQNLVSLITSLRGKEQDLLAMYTTSNLFVQSVQTQIASSEAQRKKLEDQFPALAAVRTASSEAFKAAGPPPVDLRALLRDVLTKQDGLVAKIQALTNSLAQVRSNALIQDSAEDKILQLQRDKQIEEEEYKHFLLSTKQQRIDEAQGPGRVSGIGLVETPTPPGRDGVAVSKAAFEIIALFFVAAFSLPFVVELYLDQTLKRPSDVQAKLGVPFFLTLPKTSGNGKVRVLDARKNVPLLSNGGPAAQNGVPDGVAAPMASGHLAPWDDRHALRPFFETLRDRLMTYFEMINLTHKPKLVAVTSCGAGAGVTTTASGLASTLSETGEGNVLLVNMNVRDGEAHRFYRGKLACSLEEVLQKEKRDDALVQDHLYVAKESEANDNLPRVLPKRFSHLVGKMKASDYDYIIFDMPPVSQISITPRLARYMDMVLLVVESEKTDRDVAKRATALLSETKTNVGVVLNKSRDYLPRRLQHDI